MFPVVSPVYRDGAWPTEPAELGDHLLIHHPESSWRLWLDPAQPHPSRSAPGSISTDQVLVLEAAASGHGIGLARRADGGQRSRFRPLVRILDRAVPAEYRYWAVWSGSSPKVALIDAFVKRGPAVFEC